MIREILRENYYFIEEKSLNLNEDIVDDIFISGDKRLLKKAFINIVRNAIIHSPKGESINIILNGNKFIVENTGVYIEESEINNIFKAFYRIDKSRNSETGGTGLGLYIVKSILDKHSNLSFEM